MKGSLKLKTVVNANFKRMTNAKNVDIDHQKNKKKKEFANHETSGC